MFFIQTGAEIVDKYVRVRRSASGFCNDGFILTELLLQNISSTVSISVPDSSNPVTILI
jgi:hypothetical protein